jgi:hypothetical protein
MTYRVVVTGHTAEGASVVLREEAVAETPGWILVDDGLARRQRAGR